MGRRREKPRLDGEGYPVSGRLHVCIVCGKEEQWGPEWEWFGSYRDLDDGLPIEKFCSETCKGNAEVARQRQRVEAAKKALANERAELEGRLALLQTKEEALARPLPRGETPHG